MKKLKIAPSMMCADFINLKSSLDIFHETNIDYLHIDVMDGHYVPNFTLGIDFCKRLSSYTHIPLDIHLMIDNPDRFISDFAQFKSAVISFHPETVYYPLKTVDMIKSFNAKAGIAIEPSLSLEYIRYIIPDVDFINVMTVNPGYSGQKLIPQALDKIKEISDYIREKGYEIEVEVDGNVSWKNIPRMLDAGAEVFVAGTSSIFGKKDDLKTNIIRFKSILNKFKDKMR